MSQVAVLYSPENEAISGGYSKLEFDPRASLTIVAGYNEALNTFDNVRLETGANFLDKDLWESIKEKTAVLERLNGGVIEEIKPSSTTKPDSLNGFKLADARRLISVTSSVAILKKWQENTNNKQVYAAIANRIQKLNQGLAI